MGIATQSALRLLVIDDDDDLRLFLHDLLSEEGYLVDLCSTLDEALIAINSHVYHLIITDLLAHSAVDPLHSAIAICEAAAPTPVMALTGWNISADEVVQAGLIRLAPKPFDITNLLSVVAECSSTMLNLQQQRWGAIVGEHCAAVVTNDLDALATHCADDVRIEADLRMRRDAVMTITGRASYRTRLEQWRAATPDLRIDDSLLYPHPDGVALRAVISWQASGSMDGRMCVASSVIFRFTDQLISQLTIRASEPRPTSLQSQSMPLRSEMDVSGE